MFEVCDDEEEDTAADDEQIFLVPGLGVTLHHCHQLSVDRLIN